MDIFKADGHGGWNHWGYAPTLAEVEVLLPSTADRALWADATLRSQHDGQERLYFSCRQWSCNR